MGLFAGIRDRLGTARLARALAVLAVVACALAAYGATAHTSTGERLELATVDARFALRGQHAPTPDDVAIVVINDETDHRLGQRFPYPRRFYGDAIRALNQAGARAVVFDVNFDFASGSVPDDEALVRAAREHPPVVFVTAPHELDRGRVLPTEPLQEIRFPGVPAGTAFDWSNSTYGLAHIQYAADGTVRSWRVRHDVASKDGTALPQRPALAFAALQAAGADTARRVPDEVLLSHGVPAKRFPQINLADVLAGKQLERVAGKTVFVGATSQVLHDVHPTPYDQNFPGVMLHAQAYEDVQHGEWLTDAPSWTGAAAAAALVLLWCAAMLVFPLAAGLAVGAAATAGYAALAHGLFVDRLLVAPVAAPVAAAVATAFALVVRIAWRALRERRRIAAMFSRYVSPEVVKEIVRSGDGDRMVAGQRREVTLLFSDVRGFTSMSEHRDPEEVVAQLNEFLAEMTEVVYDCGGTIDKFMGDGMMVLFGAPVHQPDHAARACAAARAMVARLQQLNARRELHGLAPLRIGIGINSGSAIVGNVGSHRRVDFTAIGDTVNLAARLESATVSKGVSVLVGASTAQAAPGERFDPQGEIVVKGRTQATEVYSLAGLDAATARPRAA